MDVSFLIALFLADSLSNNSEALGHWCHAILDTVYAYSFKSVLLRLPLLKLLS